MNTRPGRYPRRERAAMFTALAAALILALPALAGAGPARGTKADGEVAITSPTDGETIRHGTVDVLIELRDRGSRGNHVHLYVDGRLIKPLYGDRISYTLRGLTRGRHTITVRLATKRHRVLDPHDSITVNVR